MRGCGDEGMRNGIVIPSERSEPRDLHLRLALPEPRGERYRRVRIRGDVAVVLV
jgi:hypothetical protein